MAEQALNELYKDLFDEVIKELRGMPNRAILADPRCVTYAAASGSAKSVDRIGRNPDQTVQPTWEGLGVGQPMADRTNTQKFTRAVEENAANNTLANYQATLTPHDEVGRVRSWYEGEELELGYEFDKVEQIEEQLSARSGVISQLRKEYYLQRNAKVIQALTASTVKRGRRVTATSDVLFPEEQTVVFPVVSTVPTLGLEVLNSVREKFLTNFIEEPVFTLINPRHQSQLINADGDKLHSRDFVTSEEYFASGTLPQVYGHHIIPHPQMPVGTMVSWVPDAIEFGVWLDHFMRLAENPGKKYNLTLFMLQIIGAVRADDRGVVHTLTQAALDARYDT